MPAFPSIDVGLGLVLGQRAHNSEARCTFLYASLAGLPKVVTCLLGNPQDSPFAMLHP